MFSSNRHQQPGLGYEEATADGRPDERIQRQIPADDREQRHQRQRGRYGRKQFRLNVEFEQQWQGRLQQRSLKVYI